MALILSLAERDGGGKGKPPDAGHKVSATECPHT